MVADFVARPGATRADIGYSSSVHVFALEASRCTVDPGNLSSVHVFALEASCCTVDGWTPLPIRASATRCLAVPFSFPWASGGIGRRAGFRFL